MDLKVKITKGSNVLPKGCVCKVFYIDVRPLGFITQEQEVEAWDKDEEEFIEETTTQPEMEEVVEVLFYVASPVTGKFMWVSERHCESVGRVNFRLNAIHRLKKLRKSCMKCSACPLGQKYFEGYLGNVFSSMRIGSKSRVMVVGQNPGQEEVESGTPFVGASGKIFNKELKRIGLSRRDIYVTNVVKCKTEKNKAPKKACVDECKKRYLDKEIKILNPDVIVVLGNFALNAVTGESKIMECHGNPFEMGDYTVVPVIHPSPLNTNNPEKLKMFREDMEVVASVCRCN